MKKIILASASPRRKELLQVCGVSPEIVASNIEENISGNYSPEEIVMSLSFQKTLNVAQGISEGIVIGADTVVVLDGEILGKPSDASEALSMLTKLSGKPHRVITGLAVIDTVSGKKHVEYETTLVYFKNLHKDEINAYIDCGEYSDKAGSYAIQGKGSLLVEKIEGCYFNVVGLPISRLNSILRRHFDLKLL